MATLLVSDTSVLIDLDRGAILHAIFKLPYEIGVPDVLYEGELKHWPGWDLESIGLRVLSLDGAGVLWLRPIVLGSGGSRCLTRSLLPWPRPVGMCFSQEMGVFDLSPRPSTSNATASSGCWTNWSMIASSPPSSS
jgi:hypothetical protein